MKGARGPVDAVVALSYRCNLRCVTCDLAGREGGGVLSTDVLRHLPPSLRYVNLTGGEPFLLDGLAACARAVAAAAPRAEITISTNGSLPERAEAVVRELLPAIPALRVAVSVDGLEATHDLVRGAPGSFRLAMDTAARLRPLLGRNVHLAFTVSAANAAEFASVAALADRMELPLSLAVTHTSSHYFRPSPAAVPAAAATVAAAAAAATYYLRRFSPAAAARAFFAAGFHAVATASRRPIPCRAGDRFFYLDPDGYVYLCNMRAETLGRLPGDGFAGVWGGAARRSLLPTAGDACPVQCWMVCTARTAIRDHPTRVGWWAFRANIRRLLGRPAPWPAPSRPR